VIKWQKKILLVLFSLTMLPLFSQFHQVELQSAILSKKDSTPIGFVHIINLTTRHGVISDYNGVFNFTVDVKDTIKISVLGYESQKIVGEQVPKIIYLTPKNYELEEFTVLPYKDYEEFKEAFINLVLPDSSLKMNPHLFMFGEEMFLYRAANNSGITIEGPISGLFDLFSKHAKSKRRYEELLARDRFKSYLSTKFNNKIVANSTPLKDQKEISDFMIYCDFSDDFLAKSNLYDIVVQIQRCYKEFSSIE
jgi:hypothetical protein